MDHEKKPAIQRDPVRGSSIHKGPVVAMNLVGSRKEKKARMDRAIRVRGRKVNIKDEVREVEAWTDHAGSC